MCTYTVYRYPCGQRRWCDRRPFNPDPLNNNFRCHSIKCKIKARARRLYPDDPIYPPFQVCDSHCTQESLCTQRVVRQTLFITHSTRCRTCELNQSQSRALFKRWGTAYTSTIASPGFVRKVIPSDLPLPTVREPCYFTGCLLDHNHELPHVVDYKMCQEDNCFLVEGHQLPHKGSLTLTSRTIAAQFEVLLRQTKRVKLERMTSLVIKAMESQPPSNSVNKARSTNSLEQSIQSQQQIEDTKSIFVTGRSRVLGLEPKSSIFSAGAPFQQLNFRSRQVRLFELLPRPASGRISGVFYYIDLAHAPSYTALSYTWGSPIETHEISLYGYGSFKIRTNLYDFLHLQSGTITQPQKFWIDALCIDQTNVHERNHQVSLMKDIYAKAERVSVWLGKASNNSDVAMSYISQQSATPMRQRGQGFHPIWTKEQGEAVRDLCQRPYWRRMWIIQEILYARELTVWCGSGSFEWVDVEKLYLKLKTLEETNWFTHHAFVIDVMQSPAAIMVWQRAHWRHPETPAPALRTLIEIFRQWQCADVRDKIFALASMASDATTIVPDYALSSRQVYDKVCKVHEDEPDSFKHMLSQVLALSAKDLDDETPRVVLDYRTHAADDMVIKRRIDETW